WGQFESSTGRKVQFGVLPPVGRGRGGARAPEGIAPNRQLSGPGPVSQKALLAPNNAAHNASDAANLRNRLTAEEISGGHAFDKHVVQKGEFPGTTTRQQFAGQVEDVIRNHTHYRDLSGGRVAYWDDATGTVVIRNPKAVDGGTAFKPTNGKTYFDGLK